MQLGHCIILTDKLGKLRLKNDRYPKNIPFRIDIKNEKHFFGIKGLVLSFVS